MTPMCVSASPLKVQVAPWVAAAKLQHRKGGRDSGWVGQGGAGHQVAQQSMGREGEVQ